MKVGSGSHTALLYGYPNPEEPLGGLLLDYFSRALVENQKLLESLDYTWYMIKCADPDGAELNEPYLDGSYTPINFALNFYRTPIKSTGWTAFPFLYGDLLDLNNPTPETLAMMKIMDAGRVDLMCGFHQLRFGSTTFQVSEPCPRLYAPFQILARQNHVPLRKRPGTLVAEGIQLGSHLTPLGNYIRAKHAGLEPLPPIVGARMIEYERLINPNCFDLVPESPMWYDPRCYNDSPSDTTLEEALSYASAAESTINEWILDIYKNIRSGLTVRTRLLDMVEDFVQTLSGNYYNIFDPPVKVPEETRRQKASIAQKIETEGRADIYYSPCYVSMLMRTIDRQMELESNSILRKVREDCSQKFEELKSIIESKYDCKHYPLKNLIRMNLGSVLYSAQLCSRKKCSLRNVALGLVKIPGHFA